MRVLHLNSEKSWRGGEQQVLYLTQELQKYQVSSFIGCKKKSALSERCQQSGVAYFTLPFLHEFDLYSAYLINRLCQEHAIELVHVHASHAHSTAFFSILVGNPLPFIVSRRVDYPLRKNLLSRMKYNIPSVKKILCVSQCARKVLEPDIKEKHKLLIIHSGIDTQRFAGKNRENCQTLRKRYQLSKDCILVGNTSALSPQKDYYTFIDSAQKIIDQLRKDRKSQVHFFIIGDGKSQLKLEKYVREKKLNEYIHFTGFYQNIVDILPELDIFLFTSQEEALGTAVLDAFAANVPVVATDVGGISEMIENEKNGYLAQKRDSAKLAQHVLKLIEKPQLRKQIAEAACEKLREFKKEKTASSTYQVYKEVLAE